MAAEELGACNTHMEEMAARESHTQEIPLARAESDGGMLGGDLTVVCGSVRWTGKLFYRANVAACGAAMARGKTNITFWGHVRARGSLELTEIA